MSDANKSNYRDNKYIVKYYKSEVEDGNVLLYISQVEDNSNEEQDEESII